ncbi:kinesin-like protein KIN-5B [Magnolia sinica]|uniref:kinesin-like protein KIN-5B n=1 Tax=Magnolia sinica TaxID=86752 RepID=UPI00265A0224|nr:kinesin-like protein KIN-5B [Magnolia sinica]XP_058109800.1 kinesin-like protein KIN-5B [Magnolia sinica]
MSFTPDQHRKLGSATASPSPSPSTVQTPRTERRRLEPRWTDGNRQDRDREVNVQVLLRCRPLTDDEQRLNVPKVISCNEQRKEVTVLQSIANKQVDRAFTFDKVFGPKAQQRSIYDQAISPIVNEVLEGFNCTVFAYGQTGTGKTYTMEGGIKNKGGELPVDAGVIPRAVRHIFDALEAQKADYSMKVTFLELYNEEITDLLAPEDCTKFGEDSKQRKPISLMEDGKGGVVVRGLEEEVVYSANEIYNLLERGSAKRRTVETLLNKHSSRSHSIFSITIYIKESNIGDEELIKCGKLNLVDLAGSENISRSGAREGRAREAGEINKSLLTLGRVITALVEHSGHIPYRDSKLTRLLRDSLGGKTKTCIIATISPSPHCLEETLSTLDYASRAKNIKNKPEANQRMSKSVLLKDLYVELERMKQDVRAAREKNGVYIPHERFAQDEAEKKAMSEKIEHLEFDLDLKGKQVDTYKNFYNTEQERNLELQSELRECKMNLKNTNKALEDLQENHRRMILTLEEKEFIISNLLHSENSILERAKELCTDLQTASEDITTLFSKIDCKNKMETENQTLVLTFGSQLEQSLKGLHKAVVGTVSQQHQQLRCMEERVGSFIASKCEATKILEQRIEKMKDTHISRIGAMKELADALQQKASSNIEELKLTVSAQAMAVENFLVTVVSEAELVLHDIHRSLAEQKQLLAFSAQQQEEGLQRTLVSTQAISKATVDFFSDLHGRASKLASILEENQTEKSRQLADFEKTFQEASAKEEKLALEKIAAILANLTSTKRNMVSEALGNMNATSIREKKMLQQEMSGMQQVSTNAKKEWNAYIEKVESQFQEDTYSAARTRTNMEINLQECSKEVDHSRHQWENAQLSIDHLNKRGIAEIDSAVEESIRENHNAHEKFVSVCFSTNVELDSRVSDLLTATKHSLLLDEEATKEMESMSIACSDQLKKMQENHTESITEMRNQADRCLRKEYLVDHATNRTPERRAVTVPSLESIEEMRMPSFDNLVMTMRSTKRSSKGGNVELKQQQPSPRSPLTAIN